MSAQVHQFPTDVDRLTTIATEIHAELATASRSALESAILIGERLIEAKKIAGHGGFIPWLKQNFKAVERQAQKYMNAARNADRLRANTNSEFAFTLDAIPALLALPDGPDDPEDDVPHAPRTAPRVTPVQKDRTGTKAGAAIEALRSAGPAGLGKTETAHAAGLHSPAGLARQVETGEIVHKDNRYYHADFAPEPAPLPELSLTAQQKLEVWQKRLEANFDYRVRVEAQRRLDEISFPQYQKQLDEIARKLEWYPREGAGVMTRKEYNTILKCLHSDKIKGFAEDPEAAAVAMNEAFRLFTKYEARLVSDEETRRTLRSALPKTVEEMLARKKTKR